MVWTKEFLDVSTLNQIGTVLFDASFAKVVVTLGQYQKVLLSLIRAWIAYITLSELCVEREFQSLKLFFFEHLVLYAREVLEASSILQETNFCQKIRLEEQIPIVEAHLFILPTVI